MSAPLRSRAVRRLVTLCAAAAVLGGGAGCARGGTSSHPRSRPDLITAEEMQHRQSTNAYDLIHETRSTWLHVRGRDTISGEQGEIVVMLDGVRFGGRESLRQIPVMGLVSIRYYSPIDASTRWGAGHTHGVIALSSRAP